MKVLEIYFYVNYRAFQGRFYGSNDPTNSVIALKDNGYSTRSRVNPTRLSSLKSKQKDVSKKKIQYLQSTMKIEDTEALGRYS